MCSVKLMTTCITVAEAFISEMCYFPVYPSGVPHFYNQEWYTMNNKIVLNDSK